MSQNEDAELAETAQKTLAAQDFERTRKHRQIERNRAAGVGLFCRTGKFPPEIHETILTNPKTPDAAIIQFARKTQKGELLELLSFNQQLLIRSPQIIEAIIANPFRTAEAERRAAEIKREFFEKSRGAQQIANELRAQGKTAAAEFIEQAEFSQNLQPASTDSI